MILNEQDKSHIGIRFSYSALEECVMSLHVMSAPEHHTASREWAKHKHAQLSPELKKNVDFIGGNYAGWLFIADITAYITQKYYPKELTIEEALQEMESMDNIQFAYLFLGFPAFGYDVDIVRRWAKAPESVSEDELGIQAQFLSVDMVRNFISDIDGMKAKIKDTILGYWKECFSREWEDIKLYLDNIAKKEELIFQRSSLVDSLNKIHTDLTVDENYIVFHKNPDYSVDIRKIKDIIICLSVFSGPHLMGNVVGDTVMVTLNLNFHSVKMQGRIPENLSKVLSAASDTTRLRIMKMLWNSEATTKEMAEVLDLSPSTVSLHLKLLKEADLVETSKIKKYVYYSLKREELISLQENLTQYFEY